MAEPFVGHRIVATSDLTVAQDELAWIGTRGIELRQLDERVSLDARLAFVYLGQSRVCYARFRAPISLLMEGAPFYRIVIPLEGEANVRAGNHDSLTADLGTGIAVSSEAEVGMLSSAGYAHVTISFPQDLLHRELERLIGEPIDETVEFAPLIDLSLPANGLWQHLLRAINTTTQEPHGLLPGGIPSRRLERRLMTLLLTQQQHSYTAGLRHPQISRTQRAIDVIEDRPGHGWTVNELATSVGCGIRTLQAGFQSTVGVTPTEYVRWVRLQRVHDELQGSSASAATVTDVALSWGFSHLGRFSAAYHKEFEEYPHETLIGQMPGHEAGRRVLTVAPLLID
jgi:AraC-like DNA-binding protein